MHHQIEALSLALSIETTVQYLYVFSHLHRIRCHSMRFVEQAGVFVGIVYYVRKGTGTICKMLRQDPHKAWCSVVAPKPDATNASGYMPVLIGFPALAE
jgi:hypothetical protein